MARKLPIGIQSFQKMRKDGFVYVDKTSYVYALANAGVPVFLSRPRRFGKSLLVSTLRAYFEGRRELFDGLELEQLEGDGPDAWQARPVLHLSFNGGNYTLEGGLEDKLEAILRGYEEQWGSTWSNMSYGARFQRLIEIAHAATGHRVAVLVDEYDKPLLESMHDPALEERNRATLKAFYSVLKDADAHLRFLLITGVTKFSKVSVFSDLNQLRDISLERDYADMCGITEDELLVTFGPELDVMAQENGTVREGCLERLRSQYDGYRFHRVGPGVYNPYSLLSALAKREFGSYWFETGTPTFLVRRMKETAFDPKRLTNGTIYATERRLSDYRADDPDLVPLLFQTGYLTIGDYDPATGEYKLVVPNGEVEWGLLEDLLPVWSPGYGSLRGTDVFTLRRLVEAGDTEGMRDVIGALFASIPYTRADDPFENYFQTVLWLVFALLGRYVACEVRQARGRVDCVVEARAHIYVIEFKRDGKAEEALAQIAERGYAAPFSADPRELHLIGCSFDSKTRLLADWAEA